MELSQPFTESDVPLPELCRYPGGFSVYSIYTGSGTSLSVNGWDNSTWTYDSSGNWREVFYRDAWATVESTDGYTVYDSSGNNVTGASDFFDFPPLPPVAGNTASVMLPVSRSGRTLITDEDVHRCLGEQWNLQYACTESVYR